MTASTPGIRLADALILDAEAARYDHATVFGHRLANGFEAFGFGAIEKPAGVDHDDVGAIVAGRDGIALGAQTGQYPFRIDQRLRATEADKADLWRRRGVFFRLVHLFKGPN